MKPPSKVKLLTKSTNCLFYLNPEPKCPYHFKNGEINPFYSLTETKYGIAFG